MVTNFYTLQALVQEWRESLRGCIVGDVYSQSKDELTMAFASPETTWMVRTRMRQPFQYVFRSEGYNKARRNVATLFPALFDRTVRDLRIADRDRVVFIDLDDGTYVQCMLFGSKANVLHVSAGGIVLDAFQRKESLTGQPATAPRPAPCIRSAANLKAAWRTDAKNSAKAVSRAYPLFNATLAGEVLHRAGIQAPTPDLCTDDDLSRIFEAAEEVHTALLAGRPRVYRDGARVTAYALIPIHAYRHFTEEVFDTTNAAVSLFVRRSLAQAHFDTAYKPLEKALRTARDQAQHRLDAMLTALSEESRADKYERWGHLLMAAQHDIPPQVDKVELDDLFEENHRITVPLDPALTGVENAQRYYEKARNTRLARTHAEERLDGMEARAETAGQLLDELQQFSTAADIRKFEKAEAKRLAPFLGQQHAAVDQVPYRRYDLGSGYEVFVGKNAKQNDDLTFRYARKFDYWLHARGIPGSHTVLRRPGRTSEPQKHIVEQAASIAAYYSKARGSSLVPVIIVERKHVRKPKGAAPGAVLVDREDVVIVEPGLP